MIRRPASISSSAQRSRRLDEAETEQRERRADDQSEQRRAAGDLARTADPDEPEPFEHEPLKQRDDQGDRNQQQPDPQEDPRVSDVHRARCRQDLAPAAPPAQAQRRNGRPGGSNRHEGDEGDDGGQHQRDKRWVLQEEDERARAPFHAGAEEVGRARPEEPAGRHGIALLPPALRPRDRLRPLRLQVRAGRPVEKGLLELAPPSFELDPRESSRGGGWVGRDRRERRPQLAMRASRVVAADACVRGATEIERVGELVGVRTDARVDNGVRLVDDLELVVVPARPLGPLVRAVADRDGLLVESVPRIVGVEDELDHLPVALVQVVEVVERVEEPVLERDLARGNPLPSQHARTRSARALRRGDGTSARSRSLDRARGPGSRGGTRIGS